MSLESPRPVDQIRLTDEQKKALYSNLRTARAFALLQFPAWAGHVEKAGLNFNSWEGKESVTVDTFGGGHFLKADPSEYVLSISTPDEIIEGHKDCVKILTASIEWNDWSDSVEKREERIKHTFAAGMKELFMEDATQLIERYQREDRPFAVVHLIERYNVSPLDLPRASQESFMWAFAKEQEGRHRWEEEHKRLGR